MILVPSYKYLSGFLLAFKIYLLMFIQNATKKPGLSFSAKLVV